MKKNNITKEMEENIKNYANEIETLDSFLESVRLTPGYHIGHIGNKGFINMIREIYSNSIDELMKEFSPCNYISVFYDERNHTVSVFDNGRGIPHGEMARIFSSAFTSSNYTKKEGEFSSGLHGSGSKITNALSSLFAIESYVLGKGSRVEFSEGVISNKGEYSIPNKNNIQGTKVTFRPDYKVMGNITTSISDVFNLISAIVPLTKIGSVVDFSSIDMNGKENSIKIVNTDGILSYLYAKTSNPYIKPITMEKVTKDMKAEIAFTFDIDDNSLGEETIVSFANFCPTTAGGTHVNGFIEGVTRFFREYMNKIYLKNSGKITVVNNDIKIGLKAIVTVSHLHPRFTSQAKVELDNEDMTNFVKILVSNRLELWIKENPTELQKLCRYFKDMAESRIKSDETKINLTKKYKSTSLSHGMPEKFVKPNGKKNLELFIVEGDSALGSARNSRDKQCQGLFPIRGKLPNAFTTAKSAFLGNAEVASIITIIGAGYGKSFDIDKCPWEKVVIMADADPDGAHIRSLLLKFFMMYMPTLITHGRLYGSIPPLYGVKISNKIKYFTEKIDFVRYIQNSFSKDNTLYSTTGRKLINNEVIDLLYKNMDYVAELDSIANTYAINPQLLELCLIYQNEEYKKFKKTVEGAYRFIKVEKKKDIICVNGLVDNKYNMIIFNQKLLDACKPIMNYIDNSDNWYLLNNEKISLYTLMHKFNSYMPSNITRYKGIGEMNPNQLAESTLLPDSNRMLIKYEIEDLKKEMEAIRYLESNKGDLLKNITIGKNDVM